MAKDESLQQSRTRGRVSRRKRPASRQAIISALRATLPKIESKGIPVQSMYLYGSYAHGRPKPYSDVDVAVISPVFGDNIIKDTVRLLEVFEQTELMVEPRAYSTEEYATAQPGTFLHEEIIKKGICVYEKQF